MVGSVQTCADAPISVQTLSGRGDKDVQEICDILPKKWADRLDWRKLLCSILPLSRR